MTVHPAHPAGFVSLSPEQRVWVLRAATNLFGSEEPNPRLEPMLRSQGVNYHAIINRAGPICLRRIIIEDGSGIFEFDNELGEPAFIMAVHGLDAESVIDLIAWPIMRPEVFGSYFGYAGLLGGDAVVNPGSFIEAPCPIWATPLAWLQADLHGCVVLDPSLAAPILRSGSRRFQGKDYFAKILTACCPMTTVGHDTASGRSPDGKVYVEGCWTRTLYRGLT